jgi:hypothetical protein
MARASITVRSQHEADAVKLSLKHPALRTASVITGLLLQVPSDLRGQVLQLAHASLRLASMSFDEPDEITGNGDGALRLHDGGDTGE